MKSFHSSFYLFLALLFSCGEALPPVDDSGVDNIRINQLGYFPNSENSAVITRRPEKNKLFIVDALGEQIRSEITISDSLNWNEAGQTVWAVDFTAPATPGDYRLYVPGVGYSYKFRVAEDVLESVFKASVKAFYFQRASTELPQQYAGKWARPAGHPDTMVLFHPFSGRISGQTSSPKGWYDAGDYNKYVVNGAFPTGQLLALHEDIGDPLADGSLNIPESNNGKSDYLDELKWELDWLLTMQDTDGGLFHKLTAKAFEGMTLMPHEALSQRYIVGKGTAASLNFAACMAQAYRIYKDYDGAYATNLLNMAKLAWSWAIFHPDVAYTNPPDVSTGQYGDDNFDDEFYWAASELFLSTQDAQYKEYLLTHPVNLRTKADKGWKGFMSLLGAFSQLRHPDRVPASLYNATKADVIALADSLAAVCLTNDYGQPLSKFGWGSNSDVLNAAMVMIAAQQLAPKAAYTNAIRSCADYVLGKNAVGYSFVTGYGYRSPMHIHHRQSAADEVTHPVPGLLSGGPNPAQQDKEFATYPEGLAPMQSWVDQQGSYASNEICLNWNAPLAYVLGWLNHTNKE